MSLFNRIKIFDKSGIRWLAAELTVVVLGILIAFQIEGYWTYLEEREEEQISLNGVLIDLKEDARRIEASTAQRREQLVGIEQFVRFLLNSNKSAQTFAEHYRPVVRVNTYYPVLTTYLGMQNNNRMFVISNTAITRALSQYERRQTMMVNLQASSNAQWQLFKDLTKPDIHFATRGFAQPGAELVSVPMYENDKFPYMLVYLPVDKAPRMPGVHAELGDYSALVNGLVHRGQELLEKNQRLQLLIENHLAEF